MLHKNDVKDPKLLVAPKDIYIYIYIFISFAINLKVSIGKLINYKKFSKLNLQHRSTPCQARSPQMSAIMRLMDMATQIIQ